MEESRTVFLTFWINGEECETYATVGVDTIVEYLVNENNTTSEIMLVKSIVRKYFNGLFDELRDNYDFKAWLKLKPEIRKKVEKEYGYAC